MCPVELGYDADEPPCLRLLPIETRLEPQSLADWRDEPERWTEIDLDVDDADAAGRRPSSKVAEVRWVTEDEARALGFWHDEAPDDNPLPDADGRVEVPALAPCADQHRRIRCSSRAWSSSTRRA